MKAQYFSAARFSVVVSLATFSLCAAAQTCFTSDDMDAATRTAIQNAGTRYFDMVAHGDATSLKQNSIPDVASNFTISLCL